MLNVSSIRGFLLQHPKPHQVRVTREDGDVQLVKPKNYQKTAETIAALKPELLECLDKDGNLLRAKDTSASSDAPSDEEIPIPAAIAGDPQAAAFALYARLLARAYVHSTDVAFGKMVELFERSNERSDSIERRLERAEAESRRVAQEQIDDAWERATEAAEKAGEQGAESALGQQLFSAFLAGQAKSRAAAAAPIPNGKGKGHES